MIEWCNYNSGFVTMLQTISTVFLSIVAIIITVHFSRLAYKMDLIVYSGLNYDKNGDYTLNLYLYNSGNIPLYIKGIQVARQYPDKTIDILALGGWFPQESGEESCLPPKMAKTYFMCLQNCNAAVVEDTKIKIMIETEEKTFEKVIDWGVG